MSNSNSSKPDQGRNNEWHNAFVSSSDRLHIDKNIAIVKYLCQVAILKDRSNGLALLYLVTFSTNIERASLHWNLYKYLAVSTPKQGVKGNILYSVDSKYLLRTVSSQFTRDTGCMCIGDSQKQSTLPCLTHTSVTARRRGSIQGVQ